MTDDRRRPRDVAQRLDADGRRIAVVGLGASGLAAVRVLRGLGAEVVVTEALPREQVRSAAAEAESLGASVLAGTHAPEHLAGVDVLVTSPGVPEHAPVLRWAAEAGIEIWSELDLGAGLTSAPYAAVTGTNGKTTTTEMIAAAMRASGLDAIACGNAGHPFALAALEGHEALAVEASSFQLRFHHRLHPRVSVLLNLAPDHLDWHGGMDAYAGAKARIHALQGPGDTHVGNRDDAAAAALSRSATCRVVWFTLGEPADGEVGFAGDELVARLDGEVRLGALAADAPAHRADAAAAAAAALSFPIEPGAVADALRSFRPLPHRGAIVAEAGGVRFVDDSKATNPHAALGAIAAWPEAVLIAGGLSKGVDLSPLLDGASHLRALVVLGEAADELEVLFEGRIPVDRAGSIEEATELAHERARPDGTVLLAPACASQDMFRDYAERGDRFAAAAAAIAARGGA